MLAQDRVVLLQSEFALALILLLILPIDVEIVRTTGGEEEFGLFSYFCHNLNLEEFKTDFVS